MMTLCSDAELAFFFAEDILPICRIVLKHFKIRLNMIWLRKLNWPRLSGVSYRIVVKVI